MVFYFCQNEDINLITSLILDYKFVSIQRGLKLVSRNFIFRFFYFIILGESEERYFFFVLGVGGDERFWE